MFLIYSNNMPLHIHMAGSVEEARVKFRKGFGPGIWEKHCVGPDFRCEELKTVEQLQAAIKSVHGNETEFQVMKDFGF